MKTLLALLLLLPVLAFAAPKKSAQQKQQRTTQNRAPKQIAKNFNGFRMIVIFGEQKSYYTVWQDQRGKFYAISKGGAPTIGSLSDPNFSFLTSQTRQIASLKGANVHTCPRANIQLYQGNKYVQGTCLGLKNQTTVSMTQMANILSTLQ